MSKGDTDRGHSRENYEHIFRKEECDCGECRPQFDKTEPVDIIFDPKMKEIPCLKPTTR